MGYKRWTVDELDYVREHYPNELTYTLALHLNRSEMSVRNQAFLMGLRKLPYDRSRPPLTEKLCLDCLQVKSVDKFGRTSAPNKGRAYAARCKECYDKRLQETLDQDHAYATSPDTEVADYLRCTSCNEAKPPSEFYPNRRSARGRIARCKACIKQVGKKRTERTRNQVSAASGIELRICPNCGEDRPSTLFIRSKQPQAGYPSWCKDCRITYRQARNQPLSVAERDWRLQQRYGLTYDEYETMAEQQNNLCMICQQPETQVKQGELIRLAVDHNHMTGKVRGLLCRRCNSALGLVRESADLLSRMIKYLQDHAPTVC